MSKIRIVAHTLVKNESRWVWFAIKSVLDFVDEIMVWDTGSTDNTVAIINSISSPKIKFRAIGKVDADGHTAARQAMLAATDADWILILDGDEIWYQAALRHCSQLITDHPHRSAIISPFINLVGDVYHFQAPGRSNYQIGPYHGPYNLRFINRKIRGLHVANPHGRQEYRDINEVSLQNFPREKLALVDQPYLHTTHLRRSVTANQDGVTLKRAFKYRYELGRALSRDFVYPEVFYLPRPALVPDPWTHRNKRYILEATLFEPGRIIKNLTFRGQPAGY